MLVNAKLPLLGEYPGGDLFMPVWKSAKGLRIIPKLLNRPQVGLTGKIFPSGRFVLGSTPKKSLTPSNAGTKNENEATVRDLSSEDFFFGGYGEFSGESLSELPRVCGPALPPLGSSSPANSRKRGKRGCRGISAQSADMLKYWIGQMEAKYGKSNISFLTLTVPSVHESLRPLVQASWSKIVHRFVEALKRYLRRRHAKTDSVFGASEVQIKRSEKEGWNVPHLHLVFVGRRGSSSGWLITPIRCRAIWRRILFNAIGKFDADFRAAENLQRVERSAARYLSKYLSKQVSKSASPAADGEWHPSDYIVCGRRFRGNFRSAVVGGAEVGEFLVDLFRRHTLLTDWWARPVCIESSIGPQVVAWVGYCSELATDAPDEIWEACG